MDFLDFAADIGNKVFGVGESHASKVAKEAVENNNPGVSNLEVSIEDDVCTVSGECESASAKEKVILLLGNMMGISQVKADELTAPEPTPEEEQVEYYIIEKGDTLWAIAEKFLGNGSKYTEIFEANREVIQDPDKIFVGQQIRIPK